jgi:hypothetical protein
MVRTIRYSPPSAMESERETDWIMVHLCCAASKVQAKKEKKKKRQPRFWMW